MKKFIFLLIIVFTAFLLFAYLKIFKNQAVYQQSVTVNKGAVLVLNNIDLGQIKILTADTDQISFELEGDDERLSALRYKTDGLLIRFGLSEDWSEVMGTITVPEGILLDLTLSENSVFQVNDLSGSRGLSTGGSFLVDTVGLTSLEAKGGELVFNASGNLLLWNDEQWKLLGEDLDADEEGIFDQNKAIYCGTGSQAIRDYCCLTQNSNVDTPVCDGLDRWVFDNSFRQCSFVCEEVIETENAESEDFNHPLKVITEEAVQSDFFDDPVSSHCSSAENKADRNLCCNDSLKNKLSSGPRPGFPDCIGTWVFDGDVGCVFECADRAEMFKILNEIKEGLQNQ